jgi:hypothetical protein
VAWLPYPARAQIVPGVLDDATVLRPGMLRIEGIFGVARAEQRYGLGTPGRPDGSLEPLAADYEIDNLGTAHLPGLLATEQSIRELAGVPTYMLSLGRPAISSEVSSTTLPVSLDVGVTRRFMVGVTIPYVKTRNQVRFDFNPASVEGNVGINPALIAGIARTTNTVFRDQVTQAAASLRAALDFCAANPGAGNCPQLEANRPAAEALIVESRGFRDKVEAVYGSDTATSPSLLVPRAASLAQALIDQHAADLNASYRAFLALDPSAADPIAARPFAAQTPIAAGQAQALFTDPDPRLGVAASPIQSVERVSLGDVEVSAKLLLFDTFGDSGTRFGLRSAVGAAFRFATGREDDPNDFFDVPTGDGQNDVEVRTALDVMLARRVTTSLRARYTIQLPDRISTRITDAPGDVFPAAYRLQEVDRDLGDIIAVEAVPRFAVNEYFSVVGHYLLRRKAEDRYTGRFTIPGSVTGIGDIDLDATTLQVETRATEHRVGFGFSFSLQQAAAEGRSRWPVELSYLHSRTIQGSGGNQPKWSQDVLQLRIMTSLFGR